jgi:hypothetical protein
MDTRPSLSAGTVSIGGVQKPGPCTHDGKHQTRGPARQFPEGLTRAWRLPPKPHNCDTCQDVRWFELFSLRIAILEQ